MVKDKKNNNESKKGPSKMSENSKTVKKEQISKKGQGGKVSTQATKKEKQEPDTQKIMQKQKIAFGVVFY